MPLKLMPNDDQKLEQDLEKELAEMKEAAGVGKYEPPISPPPDPPVDRELISRSREAFTKQIALLTARVEDIDRRIDEHVKALDVAIAKLNDEHRKFLHEAERDLYQVKTLRGAVELAIAALGERDEQTHSGLQTPGQR